MPCALAAVAARQARGNLLAQSRHRKGQFVAAPWRFPEPERNRRRRAFRILDAQAAALDAQHAIGDVAQLEDVASHALDREILVHRADHLRLRLEHDFVVGGVGNRAARCDRSQPRAASRAQRAVDRVAVQVGRTRAAPRRVALGEHAADLAEFFDGQVGERIGAAHEFVEFLLVPFAACDFGDDLLRKHV